MINPTIVRRLNGKGCGDGKTCYNGDYGYEGRYAYRMYLNYLNVNAYLYDFNKVFGFSVRCVKDE